MTNPKYWAKEDALGPEIVLSDLLKKDQSNKKKLVLWEFADAYRSTFGTLGLGNKDTVDNVFNQESSQKRRIFAEKGLENAAKQI